MIKTLDAYVACRPEVQYTAEVESQSRPGVFWHPKIFVDGTVNCNCPGFLSQAYCNHLRNLCALHHVEYPIGQKRQADAVDKIVGDVLKAKIKENQKKLDGEFLRSRRMAATSLMAWNDELFQEHLGEKQGIVLRYIIRNPGQTDMEIAKGIGWPINTITPRRGELVGSLIKEGTMKRNEGTDKLAKTWHPTSLALLE